MSSLRSCGDLHFFFPFDFLYFGRKIRHCQQQILLMRRECGSATEQILAKFAFLMEQIGTTYSA